MYTCKHTSMLPISDLKIHRVCVKNAPQSNGHHRCHRCSVCQRAISVTQKQTETFGMDRAIYFPPLAFLSLTHSLRTSPSRELIGQRIKIAGHDAGELD